MAQDTVPTWQHQIGKGVGGSQSRRRRERLRSIRGSVRSPGGIDPPSLSGEREQERVQAGTGADGRRVSVRWELRAILNVPAERAQPPRRRAFTPSVGETGGEHVEGRKVVETDAEGC